MKRTITFSADAWEDYLFWQSTDRSLLKRINLLIKDIGRNPYEEIGKPEPLKHQLTGWWSRRIDEEHRLVYRVTDLTFEFASLRDHY